MNAYYRKNGIKIGSRFLYLGVLPESQDLIAGPTLVTGTPNAGKSTLIKKLRSEGLTRAYDMDRYASHNKYGKFMTHWRGLEITDDTVCAGISENLLRSPKLKRFKNFVYISQTEELILRSDKTRKTKNFGHLEDYPAYQEIRRSQSIVFMNLILILQKFERAERRIEV